MSGPNVSMRATTLLSITGRNRFGTQHVSDRESPSCFTGFMIYLYGRQNWVLSRCLSDLRGSDRFLCDRFCVFGCANKRGVNDIVGYFLSLFSVMYGLLLGLLTVASYQNLADVEQTVMNESSALAGLYRDVSSYPEPERQELQALLREYTRYVIDEAWPLQQKGIIPTRRTNSVNLFYARLMKFEPQTAGLEIIHAETFRQFNHFTEFTQSR